MSVDYRKMLKATIRGELIDSDSIPVPMGFCDPKDNVPPESELSDEEEAAFCEVLRELKIEFEADALAHDYQSNAVDEIDAFIREKKISRIRER